MDIPQLTNWRRYLDFEENEGGDTRIQILYERCLVACVSLYHYLPLKVFTILIYNHTIPFLGII